MKEQLRHIQYDLYLIALIILTFFSFIGPFQAYLMPLLVGVGVLFILARKSIFYVIPIPFFVQMSFSELRDDVQMTTIYGIIFAILIILDVIRNRHFTKKGYLTLPILILLGLSVITHINSPDLFTTFAGFIQVFTILGLYLYFLNTIEHSKDNFRYVAKLVMYMSVMVTIEMLYVIYESGDLAIDVIRSRSIDLGWENLNVIIYSNLLSIPLVAYLIHKSKIKIFYMVFAMISIIGILLTLSRSSLLTLGVYIVFIVPILFIISKQRVGLMIQGLVFLLVFGGLAYYAQVKFELVTNYISALESRDLTYITDRVALLKIAWEQLKLHPIIGSGGIYSSRVHIADAGLTPLNYHNTIAQASTLGFLGIGAFIYLFVEKTRLIMLSKSHFKWFVLLMIYITAFVNGMFQPMYFYTTYLVFLFLVIAVVEVEVDFNKKDDLLT